MQFPKLLILFLFFLSCQQKQIKNKTTSKLKYAKHFTIIKHKEFTEVQIINPENFEIEKKYAFSKNMESIPKNKYITIQIPIKSIVCLSGTDIGMLSKLSSENIITGITNVNYIYNKTVISNFKKNKIKSFQDITRINPEKANSCAKIITYSGFGSKIQMENKLNLLGIQCLPVYDWRENHPLGKAEWIKLYGILVDKENQANLYFKKIEKEFLALIQDVKKINNFPSILSGSMIGDVWYIPAAQSFNAQLIHFAKGNFVGKNYKGTGSSKHTFEEIYKNFKHAKIWVNPMFDTRQKLLQANSKYKFFDSYSKNNIFCYSHKMNYFWEISAIEPQKVLSDLIQIFHKGLIKEKKLYFYKKITS